MVASETLYGRVASSPIPIDLYISFMTRAYYDANEIGHDFTTPPELFPEMGHCYAVLAREIYQNLGRPNHFPVFEGGGGNGTFTKEFLSQARQDTDFFRALDYIVIEQSSLLINRQQQANQDFTGKIQWHNADITQYNFPHLKEGMLIALELDDDLPTKAIFKRQGQLKEVYLAKDDEGELMDAELDASQEAINFIQAYPEWWQLVPDSIKIPLPLPLNSVKLRERFINSVQRGIMITTDYGYELSKAAQYMHNYIFSFYKVFRDGHKRFNADNDYFSNIAPFVGRANHTVEIDFTALSLPGIRAGYKTKLMDQYDFLCQHTPMCQVIEEQARMLADKDEFQLKQYLQNVAHIISDDKGGWKTMLQWKGFTLPFQMSQVPQTTDWFYVLAAGYGVNGIRPVYED